MINLSNKKYLKKGMILGYFLSLVNPTVLFSNQYLEDLKRIYLLKSSFKLESNQGM